MSPLPPAEIRRRGERFRRRRQGLLVAGAVLAVALVAVPVGVLADRGDEGPPPAEPAPGLTEIPEDFPLDAGMGDARVTDSAALSDLDYCDTTPLADLDPQDVLSAEVSGGETSKIRTLYLLEDQAAAQEVREAVLEAASDCSIAGGEDPDSVDSDVSFYGAPTDWLGDTITEDFARGQATTEPAVNVGHVVVSGNAVLVTSTYGAWSGDLKTGVTETRADLMEVVSAMEVFLPPRATDPPDEGSGELTEDALLTESEIPARERLTDWMETPGPLGEVLACAPEPLTTLGAQASVRRDFAAGFPGSPAPPDDSVEPGSVVKTAVLQFADANAAGAAFDTVAVEWMERCPTPGSETPVTEPTPQGGGVGGLPGRWWSSVFPEPAWCGADDCDAARFDRSGVALAGDRLVVISLGEIGGPLEPEGLDDTFLEVFEAAVARASGSTTVPDRETIDEPAGLTDVPVDWDLADLTGDGGEIRGPGPDAPGAAEVSPCDQKVWPVAGTDRLAVTTTGPEFAEAREVVALGSAEEAVAVLEEVRDAVDACPTEASPGDPVTSPDQTWRTHDADTGNADSVTFSVTFADGMPGGTFWQLTRVGSAIAAVSTDGEYSESSTSGVVRRLTDITAHLTPAM